MIEFIPFQSEHKTEWDEIVRQSDNGHFMFMRDYMEYHKDRFEDASYLVQKEGSTIAVFPGARKEALWNSHGGLTFGGLLLPSKHNRIGTIREIYNAFFERLKADGFTAAFIKPVPWIYHKSPCEGEIYCLNQHGIEEHYIEISTTVPLRHENPSISSLRKRMQKKAQKSGLTVQESTSYGDFWKVLSSRLNDKYGRLPVHSCQEIEMLAERFPHNIRLFCVRDEAQQCVGGSVIFITDTVWHAQYISADEKGMESGALDLLFFEMIDAARKDGKTYFDFGISTEENGQFLNENLAAFKEGFAGRSIVHQKIRVIL